MLKLCQWEKVIKHCTTVSLVASILCTVRTVLNGF